MTSAVSMRVVAAPIRPRLRERAVAFDDAAAVALGERAQQTAAWQYHCAHGGSVANSYRYRAETEAVVAIAAPDGAVAVWYARANAHAVTLRSAARAAVESSLIADVWSAPANRPGPRGRGALVRAEARLLHARVFGRPVDERDRFLAEYLQAPLRPATAVLLTAPIDALAAASALRQTGQIRQANRLIVRAARLAVPEASP
jgi:hypothetical protein